MVTAVTVLMVSLALGLLASISSRDHHKEIDEVEIFRYPRVLIRFFAFGAPVVPLIGLLVFSTFSQPTVTVYVALGLVFGGMTVCDLYFCSYLRSYSCELSRDSIVVRAFGRTRMVRFTDIKEITFVVGGRLNDRLTVVCRDGPDLRLGGGIQDFEDLVSLIKNRVSVGTRVRERDIVGHWHESVT
jgi:hypothetical protein